MSNAIALEITELNLPLITALNGGITPAYELETTYFVCEFDGADAINPRIITSDEYVDDFLGSHFVTTSITHKK